MRISAIGKIPGCSRRAYTLLEVLAVITILGFVLMILNAPNYLLGLEKTRVQYIGKLIDADLESVRLQSRVDQTENPVDFSPTGYAFKIGATTITRDFRDIHFSFRSASKNNVPDNADVNPSDDSRKSAGNPNREVDSGQTETDQNQGDHTLIFTTNGLANDFSLSWTTAHFKGVLDVKQDGTAEWKYERR